MLRAGDVLVLSDLAGTLERIAAGGAGVLYGGELAAAIAAHVPVSVEDLSSYAVIEREPHAVPFRGREFLTNPPPSSGGELIGVGLQALGDAEPTAEAIVRAMHAQEAARAAAARDRLGGIGAAARRGAAGGRERRRAGDGRARRGRSAAAARRRRAGVRRAGDRSRARGIGAVRPSERLLRRRERGRGGGERRARGRGRPAPRRGRGGRSLNFIVRAARPADAEQLTRLAAMVSGEP